MSPYKSKSAKGSDGSDDANVGLKVLSALQQTIPFPNQQYLETRSDYGNLVDNSSKNANPNLSSRGNNLKFQESIFDTSIPITEGGFG